jgi:hypothetical protein
MANFKATAVVLALACAFGSTAVHAQGKTGLPEALNVNVTNANVPVIVNNPASSPVPVTISNVPSAPIVIDAAKPALYRTRADFSWSGESNGATESFENTTGKRIVLQSITAWGQIRVSQVFKLALISIIGPGIPSIKQEIYLRPVLIGDDVSSPGGVFNRWGITAQVTAYVEPGETIVVAAHRDNPQTGSSNAHFTLTGILVD